MSKNDQKSKSSFGQSIKDKLKPHSSAGQWLDAFRGNIDKHFEQIEREKMRSRQKQQKRYADANYNWAEELESGALKVASYFHPLTFYLNMLKEDKHIGVYEWKPIVGSGMYGTKKPFNPPKDIDNDLKDFAGQNPTISQRKEVAKYLGDRVVSFVNNNPDFAQMPFVQDAQEAAKNASQALDAKAKAQKMQGQLQQSNDGPVKPMSGPVRGKSQLHSR